MTLIAAAPHARPALGPDAADADVPAPALAWVVNAEPTFRNSAGLTEIETVVLRMVATGESLEAVQRTLLLPVETVQGFLRGAYRRTGATDREQALAWAMADGLLTPVVVESPAGLTGDHAA